MLDKIKNILGDAQTKHLIEVLVACMIACVAGLTGYSLNTTTTETINEQGEVVKTTTIVFSQTQEQAKIDNSLQSDITTSGEVIDGSDIVTVDSVDAPINVLDGEEHGRGWYTPTDTPEAFILANQGYCVDTDGGWYGAQCWDLANLFWTNVTTHNLSTCGTGAAKGTLNCYEYNAGNEFDMIWNKEEIQTGDWVVFTNGEFGHIGMAAGDYNNGYVALFGQNQGGTACSGGGSTGNIVNISLNNFGGAFRYKKYIKPVILPSAGLKFLGEEK